VSLAAFIDEHIEEILVEWEAFARTLSPAADGMSAASLRDHARGILAELTADIRRQPDPEQEQGAGSLNPAASIHGALRQNSEFSFTQLAEEYRALRASVLRLWLPQVTSMSGAVMSEVLRFNQAIDAALAASAATYSANAQRTQALLDALFGITDFAVYVLSPAGMITNWNAGSERIHGNTTEEVINTHFSRFFTDADLQAGLPSRALVEAGNKGRFENEGWRLRQGGARFWCRMVMDAVRNGSGKVVAYAAVTRDMTEAREAAAALTRATEALFQSEKLQAIGRFTGGVAHDFNNVLAVIVSGAELLARQVKGPPGLEVLASMQRAASGGARLTQQLLSFARDQPLKQDRFNLTELIGAFDGVLRTVLHENIAFKLDLDPRLRPVLIDAAHFEAALLNLVTNARDAMPEGGVLYVGSGNVDLSQHQVGELAAGPFVRVTVKDSGTGMSADIAARALEPFFTTKEQGKGTGLGLSQAYGLVRQCGGDIVVESVAGRGTTVSLYLPAIEVADDEVTASTNTNAGNEKALIVDDEPDVLRVAVELFRSMGYDVLSAGGGREALDTLERTPDIQVLFSDVKMPGMDGVTLGRKAREVLPGVKVILVSGYPAPYLGPEHMARGDFHFLTKPFRASELMKVLRKAA
jgi:PAS domain S-box-containing protein